MGQHHLSHFKEGSLDDSGGSLYDHQVALRLGSYLRPHWRSASLAFLTMMVYTGTVVALPMIIKTIIDNFISKGDLYGLNLMVGLFVLIALIQLVTHYLHQRLLAAVGQRVIYSLRVGLFKHLQQLSMSFFDNHEVGSVMSRVQNDVRQLQGLLNIVVQSLADMVSLVGIVAIMLWMDPGLAILTLLVVPPLVLILLIWQRYARASFLRVRRSMAKVNSGLQENIAGVRVVQSLNRERKNLRRFDASNHENLDANLQAVRYSAVLSPSVEVLVAIALAMLVFFGGSMVLHETLEAGVIVAFALYIQRFFEPVLSLTGQYASVQRAMVAGARIFEMLDVRPEVTESLGAFNGRRIRGDVSFERVGFHYSSGHPVLEDVNISVRAGETLALVGPTGAGKTTLISLLMRMYDVTDGKITVDGHDIRDVNLKWLSRQIAAVPQEPYLFSGMNVVENIRFNHEGVKDEEVVRAARSVGADAFINKLEHGYETVLQERGSNLSVGQRQLLSFARALVADPSILILDEATANVDSETEAQIQEALNELLKGRTAVVIAHRLSTIRNADRIGVVSGGRILEEGTHSQLMVMGGLYARLYSYNTDSEFGMPDGPPLLAEPS